MENVLEEYLVKLGIQFDNDALKKAKGSVDDFKKKLEGMISKNVYATATTNFVGAIGAITIEITKMVNQVAKADMQYQLLAQRMFMSVQATKAFTLASETMGHNLQEIAWNVELREKYFDLVDMVNKLEVPQESRDMLKQVRGIGHEFDRLKLAGKLATEWLAISLLNLNKGALTEIKTKLRSFTETIFDKIPMWSKQLAEFLDVPIKLALTVIRFLGDIKDVAVPILSTIWDWLVKIWDMMAPWQKQLVILSGLLIAMFSPLLGPIAAATVALTTFFLLLEDFYAYSDGRKSSELLEPFWEFVEFLRFSVQKTILSVIVIADHLWTALKGKKHESGLGWKEHLEKELAALDKLHFDEKAKRDKKREEAKKAIADEQAKEESGGTAPTPIISKELGAISAKEESGGKGAGTVSTGKGDKGGVSYGTYQFASEGGEKSSVAKFVKSAGYEKEFAEMVPGSKEFGDKWKQIASTDPEFAKKQHEYIGKTHYAPQVEKLSKAGIDVSKRGRGVQEAVWSTAVQHGAGTSVIERALKGKDVSSMSDAEMIAAIQGYKEANVATHFKSSSPEVQKNILARIKREKQSLLQTVSDPYKVGAAPVDMAHATPGVKSMPQTPPGSPAYAKASEATNEETYNVNVTINAQTTDPKQIADEATRGVKKSIQDLRKEKFNKVIRDRVAVS
jgi:hypothetical protein